MTLEKALQVMNLEINGKTSALSASKQAIYTARLNVAKDVWFDEPGMYWNSTREYVSLPIAVSTEASYELTGVDRISKREGDFVYIDRPEGGESRYSLVPPEKLYDESSHHVAAIENGRLVFPTGFAEGSAEFGGIIRVPQYTRPADMDDAEDVLPVDNPYYAIYLACASEVAGDEVENYREPGFIARASQAMERMKDDNLSQIEEVEVESAAIYTGQSWD